MNLALLHKEVQQFLEENFRKDITKIVLKGSPFPEISTQELAVQLNGKKKAEKKIPTWFNTRGIIYPPNINLEQTSSEITASYKASLINGVSLVDLTGGFGIDSLLFSKKFRRVIHCEINRELSNLVAHNAKALKIPNMEFYSGDGLEWLKASFEGYDWIYIDPSRRDDAGGRVFKLADCLPNVPGHLELLFQKGKRIMVKTSPLLDLQAGIKELEKVKEIQVVAVENEVKELLWILEKDPVEDLTITTINFRKKGNQKYSTLFKATKDVNYSNPLTYLYEPNAAIMKSGVFDTLGKDFALLKLHPNTHLFTSRELKDFPGRRFKINQVLPYKKKAIKAAMKDNQAHVSTRNFPESVAAIRKQYNLKDGGDTYLFFTTLKDTKRVVLFCEKC